MERFNLQPYARKMIFAGKNKGVRELLQVISEYAFNEGMDDIAFRKYIRALLEKKGIVREETRLEEVGRQKRIGFAPDAVGDLDAEA